MQKTITAIVFAAFVLPAGASTLLFSTGSPDGKIGTLSMPAGPGSLETETADVSFSVRTR
jgi:hypothetical protein